MQPDALADVVVMTVKAALAPILERVAGVEARLSLQASADKALTELRDRIVTMETKAALPPSSDPAVGDIRDRLLTLETKTAAPTTVEALKELSQRVAALEGRAMPSSVSSDDLSALRDRVLVLETRTPTKDLWDELSTARLQTLEWTAKKEDAVTKDVAALRERVAVVEVRGLVPGPPGKDGADGLGFDDLSVRHDGERTFTFSMMRGDRTKDLGSFTVPVLIYRGVYLEGKTYEPGDTVTWAGSTWHCHKSTVTKPDEGSGFWKLMVKRGQEGKPGRDGHDVSPVPVVSVGGVR